MEKQKLLATLTNLHDELSKADEVDQETLEHLKRITDDIQTLFRRSGEPLPQETKSVSDRWQNILRRFRTRHPHLADMVEQITDGLAGLGI